MPRLRLAFMGTPDFAAASLAALLAAGHDIAAVYSQPPRPAGRGHQPRPSPVQQLAESHGLPVLTPTKLKTPEAQQQFAARGMSDERKITLPWSIKRKLLGQTIDLYFARSISNVL